MFLPFNKNIVLQRVKSEEVSDSGIILSDSPTKITYTVTGTTKNTEALQDKQVILKETPQELNKDYCVTHTDNVVAIEE